MNLASARAQIVADSTLEIENVLAYVAAAEHAELSLPTLENFESVTDCGVRAN